MNESDDGIVTRSNKVLKIEQNQKYVNLVQDKSQNPKSKKKWKI